MIFIKGVVNLNSIGLRTGNPMDQRLIMNVDHRLISKRLKRGWTPERAVQPPKKK